MYRGILVNEGIKVMKEDAYSYAIKNVDDFELREWQNKGNCIVENEDDFIEWFFSGNWVEEEEEE